MRALALVLLLLANPAQACRQALILALDVSGSVDATEYLQQSKGLAAALLDADVQQALLSSPGWPVYMAVFEWAGPQDQVLTLDWTPVTDTTLPQIAATLGAPRTRPSGDNTALGAALDYAGHLFARGPNCPMRTVDVSGDGKHNAGPSVARGRAALTGITVNVLAIGADPRQAGDARQVHVAELSSYFRAEVIQGPNAFVEVALGYDDYARAMRRKLLREVQTMVFGAAETAPKAIRH